MPCFLLTMSCAQDGGGMDRSHTSPVSGQTSPVPGHSSPVPNGSPSHDSPIPIYHEKQSKELCALHALNNLFQDADAFSRKQLDDICFTLSPNHLVNPHKSVFGLGNYDVNVIMAAVQTKRCEAVWFDKRRNVSEIALDRIHGFILNIPIEYRLGFLKLPSYRKHWIGVRLIHGLYYNLDSKLERAEIIGGETEIQNYLRDHLSAIDRELLLVVDQTVAENRTWLKKSPSTENGTLGHDSANDVTVTANDVSSDVT